MTIPAQEYHQLSKANIESLQEAFAQLQLESI